ncbi:MAG TPA: DUF5615 family PIN-like protein [Ktedonobacterales bacterium]
MKLLLDEHISPAVARERGEAGVAVIALREWQGGAYLEAADDRILQAAYADGWTFVTCDLPTIPPLLKRLTEQGASHGGVVLVDERSIAQNDIGGLSRALTRLLAALGSSPWENRVVFLSR